MNIEGSVALVTGANRGLGRAFAEQLIARGAAKVYATARRPETVTVPGVEVLALDVTDAARITEIASVTSDVTLLINNAGIQTGVSLVDGDVTALRDELETHLYGPLNLVRAFAPLLKENGGGAVLNVLSALSWFGTPGATAYHIAKASAWAMTNGVRLELAEQGTLVTGLHLGMADTDMSAAYNGPKLPPKTVVDLALDGIEAGATEVLADDWSRFVKSLLVEDPAVRDARVFEALTGVMG